MFDNVFKAITSKKLKTIAQYEKRVWITFGSKVGQSVVIAMKLELDLWHRLLNVYTKFQFDISKPVEKSPENFK